jgi:hypothetical protein
MPPQRPVPHRPRISWSKPAHLIRLEAVTDFDRSCFRMLPTERFSLSRLPKFPFRSYFQQGQHSRSTQSDQSEGPNGDVAFGKHRAKGLGGLFGEFRRFSRVNPIAVGTLNQP